MATMGGRRGGGHNPARRAHKLLNSALDNCSARRPRSGSKVQSAFGKLPCKLLRRVLRFWRKHWAANLRKAAVSGAGLRFKVMWTTAESTLGGGRKASGGTRQRNSGTDQDWVTTVR